ncbi:hypothetical protein GCM10027168_66050 [Streptomyces capparidis]
MGALTAAATFGSIGTSQAYRTNGVCEYPEQCFYWDGNLQGSMYDDWYYEYDFADLRFLSPGLGQGQRVKNNTASVLNRCPRNTYVYYDEGYQGAYDTVPGNSWINLFHTWNNNASYTAPGCADY